MAVAIHTKPVVPPSGEARSSVLEVLQQISPLFRALTADELAALGCSVRVKRIPSHTRLSERVFPRQVMLIVRGRALLSRVSRDGREIVVGIAGRGDIVGDINLVTSSADLPSAETVGDTVALAIPADDFSGMMARSPRFASAVAAVLAERLSSVESMFVEFFSTSVSERLALLLLRHRTGLRVDLGLTHREVAQIVGSTRETVTTLLRRFVVTGALAQDEGGFEIADLATLERIASGELPVSARLPMDQQPSLAARRVAVPA